VPAVCGVSRRSLLGTHVTWNTIRHNGIEAIMSGILDRTPTEKVYISIDKDALRDADCFTNFYQWQQGSLSLDELVIACLMTFLADWDRLAPPAGVRAPGPAARVGSVNRRRFDAPS